MKKLLGIMVLGLLWFDTANAGLKQPGPGEDNSTSCIISALDAYKEAQEYLIKNLNKNVVVYMSCSSGRWQWNWKGGKKLESIHKKSFKECTKYSKKNGTGECFLFSTNDEINWKLNDYTKKVVNKTLTGKKEHNEETYVLERSFIIDSSSEGFVKYKEQNKLTYKNPEDNIPGRFLYDQEDITDDYQVHAIYILASDSKDKQFDVKGKIEKIVLKANKHLKNKTKEKQFRLDLTKEGKLDVSFLRVDRTKKQMHTGDAATYLMGMAVKNGFYHPKKLYTIFYQDKYRDEGGQVGNVKLLLDKGLVEVNGGVTYMAGRPQSNWEIHLHELFHALGFVQLCAPKAVIDKSERWGKNDHLSYDGDIMSDRGGDQNNIDKKRKEYYGHSNTNCPMDLRKSAFLEPTEENFQLQPYINSCAITRWIKKYNHQRSLDCLAKLEF
jgi:hypothetical protein